jgi:SAM-dependent methyltransferase
MWRSGSFERHRVAGLKAMNFFGTSMEDYYRRRATEYDGFYRVLDRQHDLFQLRTWLMEQVRGLTVLEIAAGTGHWTEVAAASAKALTATDLVPEMMAVSMGRCRSSHVTYAKADAYSLPNFCSTFQAGMAHMWWSHVGLQSRGTFLAHFASRLEPHAKLLMIDQNYVEGLCSPVSRLDPWGNQLTIRELRNGDTYEIIKNFPTPEELHESLNGICDEIEVIRYRHFWAVSARFRVFAAASNRGALQGLGTARELR